MPIRVSILLFAVVILIGCSGSIRSVDVLDSSVKENGVFEVKVSSVRQSRAFGQALAGSSYIFESRLLGEDEWKRIMVVEHDDPEPITDTSLNFVNADVGFVYQLGRYAVSIDRGSNWEVRNVTELIPQHFRGCRIDTVGMKTTGDGEMSLLCNDAVVKLFTKNFGSDWSK